MPTFSSNPPVDAPDRRRLPILLRHAWFSLNQTFRRRLAPTGVTPDQFTALRTLIEHEPQGLTQSALTRLIASDPNTIGALVERMESAGWIAQSGMRRTGEPIAFTSCPPAAGNMSASVPLRLPSNARFSRGGRRTNASNFWKTWPRLPIAAAPRPRSDPAKTGSHRP